MSLYRMAHEAVANAREHADPDRIVVGLTEADAALVLSIRDGETVVKRRLPLS
jgi:two-component system CheB/CheR fusion protein